MLHSKTLLQSAGGGRESSAPAKVQKTTERVFYSFCGSRGTAAISRSSSARSAFTHAVSVACGASGTSSPHDGHRGCGSSARLPPRVASRRSADLRRSDLNLDDGSALPESSRWPAIGFCRVSERVNVQDCQCEKSARQFPRNSGHFGVLVWRGPDLLSLKGRHGNSNVPVAGCTGNRGIGKDRTPKKVAWGGQQGADFVRNSAVSLLEKGQKNRHGRSDGVGTHCASQGAGTAC